MIRRLYVEKQLQYAQEARHLREELVADLGLVGVGEIRWLLRYDVEGVDDMLWERAKGELLVEPATELSHDADTWEPGDWVLAVELLPGQFDQRADSAAQCLQLLGPCDPCVRCAEVFVFSGVDDDAPRAAIRRHLINPVDSREADLALPATLRPQAHPPAAVQRVAGFRSADAATLAALHARLGMAMSAADLQFCQAYFLNEEGRDPSITELKLLDTYWSDHCRHTTFLADLVEVDFADDPVLQAAREAWAAYLEARQQVYGGKLAERPVCLMDIALMGMKALRHAGGLQQLELSEEVNAASIVVPVDVDGEWQEWLLMFKNETHNHPTEIEPFGGAATCLGGAIRDPLSGRSYVYQALRVSGAADPRKPLDATLPGKLPQRKITRLAARGYSSYGNQMGLATGMVTEIYHPGYEAKRMEIGAVIAAAPRDQVVRGKPQPGDLIVLVGGKTGRDGIGGATGSSKEHDDRALENAAEVQKGDPPMERRLQRLFRDPQTSRRIKRCNDFGAGGVAVAIGELADSLEIDLDAVPLKYAGLDGTEIALSESQERMAVVLDPADVDAFIRAADHENLLAVTVARVSDSGRLRLHWQGDTIVDLSRAFLNTNGVRQQARAYVSAPQGSNPFAPAAGLLCGECNWQQAWQQVLSDLNVCSQRGLVEQFDSSIGAATVLHPFGGAEQATPAEAMVAKLPVLSGETTTASVMSFGYNPLIASWSPFYGALYAVVESVSRVVAAGAQLEDVCLTLQEYFERLRDDPRRWGKPLGALLGAWEAQRQLGIAAIGGKDSMSGSFKDLDVPPGLVSFAVAPLAVSRVCSAELKTPGNAVMHLPVPRREDNPLLPDWPQLVQLYRQVADGIAAGELVAVAVVREGGVGAALARMAFGNSLGFELHSGLSAADLFTRRPGDLVVEVAQSAAVYSAYGRPLARVIAEPLLRHASGDLPLAQLRAAWEQPLEPVFPTRVPTHPAPAELRLYEPRGHRKAACRVAKPRVLIPVFPGTNCEYDSAKAFAAAGAEPRIVVVRNQTADAIEASVSALRAALDDSQILMLAGGFSAGDEPGGSGKFIAAMFRNERLSDAVWRLMHERDGLILGICNGFQALVKLGLLPFGRIQPMAADSASLTHNQLGRHVSAYVRTKVVSRLSPWLVECPLGAVYQTPVSHGEGRFVAPDALIDELFRTDRIATQYVDANDRPTHALPYNPNGSMQAIEGITSPCGRIFGRMGHSERSGSHVGINIPGEKQQPIFRAGVNYFR